MLPTPFLICCGHSDPTAFGIFDKDETKDELGTLNLLTPQIVLDAAKEIQSGKSVSLNWAFDKLPQPAFGRIKYEHKLIDWLEKGADFCSFDDEITFNTQSGKPNPQTIYMTTCSYSSQSVSGTVCVSHPSDSDDSNGKTNVSEKGIGAIPRVISTTMA